MQGGAGGEREDMSKLGVARLTCRRADELRAALHARRYPADLHFLRRLLQETGICQRLTEKHVPPIRHPLPRSHSCLRQQRAACHIPSFEEGILVRTLIPGISNLAGLPRRAGAEAEQALCSVTDGPGQIHLRFVSDGMPMPLKDECGRTSMSRCESMRASGPQREYSVLVACDRKHTRNVSQCLAGCRQQRANVVGWRHFGQCNIQTGFEFYTRSLRGP